MNVRVLVRNPDDYKRETKRDIHRVPRNFDPKLHPFEVPREYQRALNAAKLERVFAKPFVGALTGHSDGVQCLAKHSQQLAVAFSGSYNGEVRQWQLSTQKCVRHFQAHEGYVRGIAFTPDGNAFYTVGDDKVIKAWNYEAESSAVEGGIVHPRKVVPTKNLLYGIDHHQTDDTFVTCGAEVCLWNSKRVVPLRSLSWGVDSVTSVRFNTVETNFFASTGSDRSIMLYDIRGNDPMRKLVLKMRSNAVAWNPMEAFLFTAANEDYNLYTFDMRYLKSALNVHMDHVSAVLDVDYSPTGKEFVSASFDKTLRIFEAKKGRSREVYHTKRMQRVFTVKWTMDDRFILSGSDETNIRLWKARAWEKLGVKSHREEQALNYNSKLKEKFAGHPKVKRILRHRHVPKDIYHQTKEQSAQRHAIRRKQSNLRAHSKPGSMPYVSERSKNIVNEDQ